jgi:hypothetical protein
MSGILYALAAALNLAADHGLGDVTERIIDQVPIKSLARDYLLKNKEQIIKPFWSPDEAVEEELKATILSPLTIAAALIFFREHDEQVKNQRIVGIHGAQGQLFRYLGINADIAIHPGLGAFLHGDEKSKAIVARDLVYEQMPEAESLRRGLVSVTCVLTRISERIEILKDAQ